ncbi:MAG: sulfurtransferase complex subunit TusC [Halioglobus sp.]
MSTKQSRKTLIITRHAPYAIGTAKAALDTILAMAAFDQPVSILFQGEGVLQLLPGQDSENSGMKNLLRQIASLVLYDVERVYVDSASADRFAVDLSTCPIAVCSLQQHQIRDLLLEHDTLLGF